MRMWCVCVQVFILVSIGSPPIALRLKMNLSHLKADAWHHHRASQTAKKMPVKTQKNHVTSGATRRICIMTEHFHSGCLPKGIVMVDRTPFPKTMRTDGKMRWIHSMYCQWNHHTTLVKLSPMLLISWKMIQAKIILPMTVAACCCLRCSVVFFNVLLPMAMLQPFAAVLVSQSGQKQRCLDKIALNTLFVASILVQANLFNTCEGYRIIGNMMRLWGSRQSQDLSLEPLDRFWTKWPVWRKRLCPSG